MEPTKELKREIKALILDALKITDVNPDDIVDNISLFDDANALRIDSIDALEIVMVLQKKYGVHIDDQNLGRFIIKSIDTIAEFVCKELEKK
jgi:acyl carrier protein